MPFRHKLAAFALATAGLAAGLTASAPVARRRGAAGGGGGATRRRRRGGEARLRSLRSGRRQCARAGRSRPHRRRHGRSQLPDRPVGRPAARPRSGDRQRIPLRPVRAGQVAGGDRPCRAGLRRQGRDDADRQGRRAVAARDRAQALRARRLRRRGGARRAGDRRSRAGGGRERRGAGRRSAGDRPRSRPRRGRRRRLWRRRRGGEDARLRLCARVAAPARGQGPLQGRPDPPRRRIRFARRPGAPSRARPGPRC